MGAERYGPLAFGRSVGPPSEFDLVLPVAAEVLDLEPGRALSRECQPLEHLAAEEVLHVRRIPHPEERPVEHRVGRHRQVAAVPPQVEAPRFDPVVPAGEDEGEVVGLPRRDHQPAAKAAREAVLQFILFRQPRGPGDAVGIGLPPPQHLPRAVAHLDLGAPDRAGVIERRHPDQGGLGPPLEMNPQVGHQGGRRDIHGPRLPQQRGSQHFAPDFDDVETGPAERNAHDFEAPGPLDPGNGEGRRPGRSREQRFSPLPPGAGTVRHLLQPEPDLVRTIGRDPEDPRLHRLRLPGLVGVEHPPAAVGIEDLRGVDAPVPFPHLQERPGQGRLDVPYGDGKDGIGVPFQDPEIGRELDQRGVIVQRDLQGETLPVFERPSGVVPELRGEDEAQGGFFRKGAAEGHRRDVVGRLLLPDGRVPLPPRLLEHRLAERRPCHGGRKLQAEGRHRQAGGVGVDAPAFDAGAEDRAHLEGQDPVRLACQSRRRTHLPPPDQRHPGPVGKPAPGLEQQQRRIGLFAYTTHRPEHRRAFGAFDHAHPHPLPDPRDPEMDRLEDGGFVRVAIEAQNEDLFLVDPRTPLPGARGPDGGAAGVKGEDAPPSHRPAGEGREAGAHRKGRADAAREVLLEIVDPVGRVLPLARPGDGGLDQEGAHAVAGVPHRRHRLGKTRPHLADVFHEPLRAERFDHGRRFLGMSRENRQPRKQNDDSAKSHTPSGNGVSGPPVPSP